MALLEVVNVSKRFGGLDALKDVNFQVKSGELVGLIGPNGAGKSTLFNAISGVNPPTSGKVLFQGEDITNKKPHEVAAKGLVRIFQATRLFSQLSVLENIRVASHIPARTNIAREIFASPAARQRESEARQRAVDIAKMVGLETVSNELAKNLPHGSTRGH